MDRIPRSFLAVDPETLARRLLGQRLVRTLDDGTRLAGIIVETEAYLGVKDRAAHSFGARRTPRNESMYARAGTAYVYFTYGMHHCVNVVCGRRDEPVAVLLRALEPVEGLEVMRMNRAARRAGKRALRETDLCSGPAKLAEALGITRELNGADLTRAGPLHLERARTRPLPPRAVVNTARIGVGYAGRWATRPLRWRLAVSLHVSRP